MVITRVCRLCQKPGCLDVTDATFELAGESFELRDAYRTFAGLAGNAKVTDALAPIQTLQICFGCTNELVAAFAFLAKVSAAEERQLAALPLAPKPAPECLPQQPKPPQARLVTAESPEKVSPIAAVSTDSDREELADTTDADNGDHNDTITSENAVDEHPNHDDAHDGTAGHPDELDDGDADSCPIDDIHSQVVHEPNDDGHDDDDDDDTSHHAVTDSTAANGDEPHHDDHVRHDHGAHYVDASDEYTSEPEYIDEMDDEITAPSPPPPAPSPANQHPIPRARAAAHKRPAVPAMGSPTKQPARKFPCRRPAHLTADTPDHVTVDLRTVLVPQYMISDLDLSTRPNVQQPLASRSPSKRFRTMDVYARRLSHIGLGRVAQLIDKPVHAVDAATATATADNGVKQPAAQSIVYMCTYCTKAFTTAHHLLVHTRKNHVCQFCLRTFDRPAALHQHMRLAHRTVRYLCALCERDFRGNSNLRYHLRQVHEVALPASWSLLAERELAAETTERILVEEGDGEMGVVQEVIKVEEAAEGGEVADGEAEDEEEEEEVAEGEDEEQEEEEEVEANFDQMGLAMTEYEFSLDIGDEDDDDE